MLRAVPPNRSSRDPGTDIMERIKGADDSVELAVVMDGAWFRIVLIVREHDGRFTRYDTCGPLENGEVAVAHMLVMHAGVVRMQDAGFVLPRLTQEAA